ncbi:hypothetical protein [Hymenobacter oligotrophus]|nr:hypothetical protein [Hymenobacter oligotrophus]
MFSSLTARQLSNAYMQRIVGGTGHYYKQALAQLVTRQARALVQKQPRHYHEHAHLTQALAEWQHRHFVSLAQLLDISESTAKRLFGLYNCHHKHQHISKVTMHKVAAFLGTKNLDEKVLGHIITHGLAGEQ